MGGVTWECGSQRISCFWRTTVILFKNKRNNNCVNHVHRYVNSSEVYQLSLVSDLQKKRSSFHQAMEDMLIKSVMQNFTLRHEKQLSVAASFCFETLLIKNVTQGCANYSDKEKSLFY